MNRDDGNILIENACHASDFLGKFNRTFVKLIASAEFAVWLVRV